MQLTIDLTEEQAALLRDKAASLTIEPAELAKRAVTDLLSQPDDEIRRIIDYVVDKNQELYERLS